MPIGLQLRPHSTVQMAAWGFRCLIRRGPFSAACSSDSERYGSFPRDMHPGLAIKLLERVGHSSHYNEC